MVSINKNLFELVSGKTVALVGPAPHLLGKGAGNTIDKCDIVCRINDIIPPQDLRKDYGSKTDIMFHNFATPYLGGLEKKKSIYEEYYSKLKMIVCPVVKSSHLENDYLTWDNDRESAVVGNYKKIDNHNIPFYWIGLRDYKELYRKIGCEPVCGILGASIILEYPIKELLVCGFSFYLGGNRHEDIYHDSHLVDEYKVNRTFGIHGGHGYNANIKQIEFFKKMCHEHKKKIRIDSRMESILNISHENILSLERQ